MTKRSTLDVGGTEVAVSNLDKVLYPSTGFTKAQVIAYYIEISRVLLPYLKDRPITLKRYPDGVDGFFFYEKRCPTHRPEWVETTRTPKRSGGSIDYCVMNDLPALVWAANLADLELHTFLHRGKKQTHPDYVAFDLDPGAPAGLLDCCAVALALRDLFTQHDLESYVKTSGGKGMQVYVPLDGKADYAATKAFAHAVALHLERALPEQVVSKMLKSLRKGKVLVDWSQNDEHKTTINVYSLRATDQPRVSTPVTWREVEQALDQKKAEKLVFSPEQVLARVEKLGDLWAPLLARKQRLPKLA